MTVNEVYDYFYRNWEHMTRELNIGRNTYRWWVNKGYVPYKMQVYIEEHTNGKLKADTAEIKEAIKRKGKK